MVDADLSKYFDTIPHSELMQCVARRIVDRKVLRLIKRWLKAPVVRRLVARILMWKPDSEIGSLAVGGSILRGFLGQVVWDRGVV